MLWKNKYCLFLINFPWPIQGRWIPGDSNSVDKNITRLFIIFYMHLITFVVLDRPPTYKGRILPLVGNLSHPPISLFLRMICECNMLLEHCSRGSFSHKCNMANWCSEFNGKEMVAFLGLPPTFTRDSTIPPSNCILWVTCKSSIARPCFQAHLPPLSGFAVQTFLRLVFSKYHRVVCF